jgi:hypothetical protein
MPLLCVVPPRLWAAMQWLWAAMRGWASVPVGHTPGASRPLQSYVVHHVEHCATGLPLDSARRPFECFLFFVLFKLLQNSKMLKFALKSEKYEINFFD